MTSTCQCSQQKLIYNQSQGLTIGGKCVTDMGPKPALWAPGAPYVCLSRVRRHDNIRLSPGLLAEADLSYERLEKELTTPRMINRQREFIRLQRQHDATVAHLLRVLAHDPLAPKDMVRVDDTQQLHVDPIAVRQYFDAMKQYAAAARLPAE